MNIGLEVHAQLRTASKMFCACSAGYGAPPNTRTCPTCLGLPGALPVPNAKAVDLAITVALALGCAVRARSCVRPQALLLPGPAQGLSNHAARPARSPPAARCRGARPADPCTVRLVRVHLEEDAGKSLHEGFPDSAGSAYLDFNRSGVPLVEIVTEPDLASAADAAEFARRLRATLVAIGASDASMEEGGLRCDANVSLRRRGDVGLGVRTEIKNLNSFRALQRALEFEIARQSRVLDGGGRVTIETRLWDEAGARTVGMRTKEDSEDYRYFPEPDLPPLAISPERLARLRAALPELPEACEARLASAYGLGDDDAACAGEDAGAGRLLRAGGAGVGRRGGGLPVGARRVEPPSRRGRARDRTAAASRRRRSASSSGWPRRASCRPPPRSGSSGG